MSAARRRLSKSNGAHHVPTWLFPVFEDYFKNETYHGTVGSTSLTGVSKMSSNNGDADNAHRSGFLVKDDGTIVVFLAGGDIVFKFPNGKEEVHFADGVNVSWDCNAVIV